MLCNSALGIKSQGSGFRLQGSGCIYVGSQTMGNKMAAPEPTLLQIRFESEVLGASVFFFQVLASQPGIVWFSLLEPFAAPLVPSSLAIISSSNP